ncbi:MAG: AhpC/TSA family protein [Prevotella sp.]|nr:AhpC/TSA family protein [Prevotella sp.]
MKKIALFAVALLAAIGCERQPSFTVEGTISGAQDSMLYLYNRSMTGIVLLDSAKLDSDGKYSFSQPSPVGPDLYVLRLSNQIINFAADSTETITISGSMPGLARNYSVSGSQSSEKIRQLSQMHAQLQQRVFDVEQNPALMGQPMIDSLQSMIRQYKDSVLMNYIFFEPQSAYAYFALSQTLDHVYWRPSHIFEMGDSLDDRAYRAVATCWSQYYPESSRAQQLYNMVERDITNSRILHARQQQLSSDQIVVSNIIDLSLPDLNGQQRTLSELQGKVVLLDFHLFSAPESGERILKLRTLYNQYHEQGLEIYQVSIDQDEHLWKQAVSQLPWVAVYDPAGTSLTRYNVQEVPEFFTISRNNELQKRSTQITDINAEIERLLRQ